MSDITIFLKGGDIPGDGSSKDGYIMCHVDPKEWGYNPVISEETKKAYASMTVDSSWLPALRDAQLAYTDSATANPFNVDGEVIKARRGLIDLEALETALNKPGLASDVRSTSVTPVIDGRGLSTSIITDTKNKPFTKRVDLNSISTGSATIGSAGTYLTCVLAYGDVAQLTGNLLFTQIGTSIETARPIIGVSTAGNDFLHTALTYHNGDPTAAVPKVTLNANTFGLSPDFTGGAGNVTIQNLIVELTATLTNNYHSISISGSYTGACKILNCMVDKGGEVGTGIIIGQSSCSSAVVQNCTSRNQKTSSVYGAFNSYSFPSGQLYFVNCVALDNNRGLYLFNSGHVVNVFNMFCADSTTVDFYNIASSTGRNNASEDATAADGNWSTAANNLTSKTSANSLLSSSWASSSFCDIDPTGDLDGAGYTYAPRTTDIRSRPVPGPNGTSIGVSEEAWPPGPSDYHRVMAGVGRGVMRGVA